VYTLLIIPWPGIQGFYRSLLVAGGQILFGGVTPSGTVRFEGLDRPTDAERADMVISVRHKQEAGWIETSVNSRQVGYLPTVVLVSLVMATPIRWARRARALCWGLLAVYAFIAARFALILIAGHSHELISADSHQPSTWGQLCSVAMKCVSTGQGLSYIVPILIWVLVVLWPEDPGTFIQLRSQWRRGARPTG
jgi:hypothetical protein